LSTVVTYDLTKKANRLTFGTVVINRIDNPFDPIGSKVTKTDLHGLTLDKYLDGYCLGADIMVSVNNKIVENPQEYLVKPNDVISYTPLVQGGGGGGGGKQILALVATIALTVVAGPAGTALGSAMFTGATAAMVAGWAFTAAILVAGSLIISSVLAPSQGGGMVDNIPELESKTYSWSGMTTSRELNKPIPVLYGKHAMGGTVINSRFYYDGSDDWLSNQIALCHGEIENIYSSDIEVNNMPYSSFVAQGTDANGWYQYRNGTFDQSIMNGYSDSIFNNGSVSRKLDYNVPFTFTSESTNIDFFRLHFEFPSGLYNMDSQGTKSVSEVKVTVQFRKVGTSTWFYLYNYDPRGVLEYEYDYQYDTGITYQDWEYSGDTQMQVTRTHVEIRKVWSSNSSLATGNYLYTKTGNTRYNKNATFTASTELSFRASSSVPLKRFFEPVDMYGNPVILDDGQYEFKVTRITPQPADEEDPYKQNKCHVRFLEEINSANINYGGIAMIGIDLKATDQLSNSRPNFKVKCTRKTLKINGEYYSSYNPAGICLDILTNKHYGMGLNISEIDVQSFKRWYDFCNGGVANTFTITKTIPSLIANQHVIAGDLVIPATDLPNGESLALSKLLLNTSSFTGTGIKRTGWRTSSPISLNKNSINSITAQYITNHSTLANGLYYIVSLTYDLKIGASCSYSLVFKDTKYSVTPKLSFNGLFDTSGDIWNSLQDVAQVGRGQVILRGNKYSCIYDDVKTVRGLFNSANSTNVTVQYLSNADIANEIEIQYSDASIGYEMNSVSVQDSTALASGAMSNKTTKQIKGITSENEALTHGRYLLASSKFLRRVITLDADIESITATVGDLVAVQTDVTQYGVGGLVTKKVSNAIFLDSVVQLEKGKTYTLKIKNKSTDDIKDYDFLAQDSDQNLFTFDAAGTALVGSLRFDDFILGISFENELYLETNMIIIPEDYEINVEDRYSFGLKGSDSILCTITDIDRSGELTRRITAIEYNESILDFNYSNDIVQRVAPMGKIKNKLSNLTASDRLVKLENNQVVAMISFSWDTLISSYYNIYLLEEDGFKNYLGNNIRETRFEYPNTVLVPEKSYKIFIEDVEDMSITTSLTYTVTAFSSPPEDISSVTIKPQGADILCSINYPNKPLDFAYYEVYKDNVKISTQISDSFTLRHPVGTSGITYVFKAVDMIKKVSNPLSKSFTTVPPSVIGANYIVDGEDIKLTINATTDGVAGFALDYYTVSYNGTTVNTKDNISYMKANFTGDRVFKITVTDVLGNKSAEYLLTVTVQVPNPLAVTIVIEGKEAVMSWGVPNSAVPIDYYEIEYDSKIVKSKSNNYRLPVYWVGNKTFKVTTVNVLGARSTGIETNLSISTGTIDALQTEVIDNNVLLKWSATQGSLPIENFILYKGNSINSLVEIGEKKGTFTTIFENNSGQYTYWLGAVDSAGNLGALKSATTLVSEPPDYILNVNWVSTFSGTKVNAKIDNGLVIPVNTVETIQQHFVNNSWTAPQAQVTAGSPLWIQPFLTSGSYTEVFDYGTSLSSSLVTLEYSIENIVGNVVIAPTISISADGTTYTNYPGQTQVYGTGFRYVKIHLQVSGTNAGVRLKTLNVKLDSKIKNDSGTGTALSTHVGGTVVNFNKSFVDITSISVTPLGTTPQIAIYDFVDTPNPTSFKVLMYDTSGIRINGQFSWSARGY